MSKVLIVVLTMLSLFCSCTKMVYSTQQVLEAYRTKDEVIGRFGLPTEKRQEGAITEWLYDYGSVGVGLSNTTARANAQVNDYGNSVYGSANGSSNTVSAFTNYQRYLKFTFDSKDRVINESWQGVDFSVREPARGKTIACIVLGAAALAAVIIIASAGSGDGN